MRVQPETPTEWKSEKLLDYKLTGVGARDDYASKNSLHLQCNAVLVCTCNVIRTENECGLLETPRIFCQNFWKDKDLS